MNPYADDRPIQGCFPRRYAEQVTRHEARHAAFETQRVARKQRFNEWYSFFKLCLMFQIASPIALYWGHREFTGL